MAVRRPTKRPIATKRCPFGSSTSTDVSSEDSPLTLRSLQESISAHPLTPSRFAALLRQHHCVLAQLRLLCAQHYRSFEDSCLCTPHLACPLARRVRAEDDTRPCAPSLALKPTDTRSASGAITRSQSTIKPHARSPSDSPAEPPRSMSSSTIWNSVNRFFGRAPSVDTFRPLLTAAELPDTSIQLGPHYSIAVNQKLKGKFKQGNVQLRLPPALVDTPDQAEVSPTVLFHRLLSAFVAPDEKHFRTKASARPCGAVAISNFGPNQFPVNYPGTSTFSQLPFEQKLMIEVRAVGLVPDGSTPRLTDNEVMNRILEKSQELAILLRESNALRRTILTELEAKQTGLIARVEIAKQWAAVPPKQETAAKKEHKRPKKRDKMN